MPRPPLLLGAVRDALAATVDDFVPWFVDNMPEAYFRDVDPDTQRAHVAALVGARATGLPPSLTLRSDDGDTWTVIRAEDRPGLLAELLDELPKDRLLRSAQVHTAADGRLVLDVFSFADPARLFRDDPRAIDKIEATVAWSSEHLPGLGRDVIVDTVGGLPERAVLNLSPRRVARFARLIERVRAEDAAFDSWQSDDGSRTVTVGLRGKGLRTLFTRVASRLGANALTVQRAYLDRFDDVGVVTFVVRDVDGDQLDGSPRWDALAAELPRLPWLDDRVLQLVGDPLDLLQSELVVALLDLAHVRLSRIDPVAWAPERVAHLARRALGLLGALADDVRTGDDAGRAAATAADRLPRDVRNLVDAVAEAVGAVLATNLALPRRGLAMAIRPDHLLGPQHDAVPHGVIYGHGDGYRAFHVRFRPIARGGLRVVLPRSRDQHTLETERQFDEVYGLSYAQQLKNKDIPEGGAKGVALVVPGTDPTSAVRDFVDGLLDLAEVTGELLYLGPDENITPAHIEWIADRAAARDYPQPLAFMSSKPGAGINHKAYGVTSEGVVVFLDVALRKAGIDPRAQPFTVKITGGPDGDVAGNLIRILHREYGDNAKIVGIADGSGSATDPDGMDTAALLALVDAERPIADLPADAVGPRGEVVPLDAPNGHQARNTLHNRVVADVFVPAGGRPRTLDAGNWRQFLQADGTPSSGIIVEGANLFLTGEARRALHGEGVVILKDSSANKCGVICSSYEIAACMLLDADGFLALKDRYVEEVLVRLREVAGLEAELLFRLAERQPDATLPELSVQLSRLIGRITDLVADRLTTVDADTQALLATLVRAHLPPSLVEAAGADFASRMPAAYITQTIATVAATRIVYREGVDYLERRADAALADEVFAWLLAERRAHALAERLEAAGENEAATLLRLSGARAIRTRDGGVA